jgi:hypothetical protein
VEQTSVIQWAADESRTLRIETDAIRTRLAIAVFAMLDVRAESSVAIEQSVNLVDICEPSDFAPMTDPVPA